ncbi:PilZ domain-containing protein [Geoalkalibacter halelectricus]|uniref:PilZ domain-containing protein n=1 Tax=Geoalkalibacter halelectricus TaxID=2847045 RepID=UPI003D2481DE
MLNKYFKPGQKVQIHPQNSPALGSHLESLTAQVVNCGNQQLELSLPYQTQAGEEFPFQPRMPLELVSQSFGLGVRARGEVTRLGAKGLIQVHCPSPLQAFQRRTLPRIEVSIGLRYARGRGNLRSLQAKWRKNLAVLQQPENSERRPSFAYRPANLSGGGIRFDCPETPEIAELCMLLLELSAETHPVCALAEVVWVRPAEKPGWNTLGMQFTHISKADQERIIRFVDEVLKEQERAAQQAAAS